jgi:hypothetical protein
MRFRFPSFGRALKYYFRTIDPSLNAPIIAGPRGRGITFKPDGGEAAYTMSEAKVIANQKTIINNQKTIVANQATIKSNQTAIKKNQTSILKNQADILKNQGALETIVENQKEILARLNK